MPETVDRARWPFVVWGCFGVLVGFGYLAIFSIGIFLLAGALLVALFGIIHPATRSRAAVSALPGLGIAPLYVALLNAGGPGERCQSTPGVLSCTELLNPWPFAIPGALLFLVGGWLFLRFTRTRSAAGPPAHTDPTPSRRLT